MHAHTYIYKFAEKTFTNGSKYAEFVKVLSLESFPLYGTLVLLAQMW